MAGLVGMETVPADSHMPRQQCFEETLAPCSTAPVFRCIACQAPILRDLIFHNFTHQLRLVEDRILIGLLC